jgi:DNA polymerase III subunit delta'
MNITDIHKLAWRHLLGGRERMAHAILLAGPPGNLKGELAYAFAASLLCESPISTGSACGKCIACNWFAQGNHPDFRWLRPEAAEELAETVKDGKDGKGSKEITIDQVRALGDFLTVGTHRAGNRVILVTPAEAMNRNTANALLKSLEEPRPGTVFVLVSDHPERLLATVRSRCRVVPVGQPDTNSALGWLRDEGIEDPERWLALAGGAPELAKKISAGSHQSLLRLLEDQLGAGRRLNVITLAAEIDKLLKADGRVTAYDVVDWTQRWLYDLSARASVLPARFFTFGATTLDRLAAMTDLGQLLKFNEKATEFKKLSQHTLNHKLFFEDFFTEYVRLFGQESH